MIIILKFSHFRAVVKILAGKATLLNVFWTIELEI